MGAVLYVLWSIALQYLIYTICILLIDHHIRYKYLFAGVILISCILIGWVYSILGIFTALIAIGMLMLTFSSFRLRVNNWFTRFLWVIDVAFRRSLNKHRRFLFWNLRLLNQEIHCSIFTLSYPLFICFISFLFKKSLETWFHTVDRRMIGTIGTLILFTYYIIIFIPVFLVKHLMS